MMQKIEIGVKINNLLSPESYSHAERWFCSFLLKGTVVELGVNYNRTNRQLHDQKRIKHVKNWPLGNADSLVIFGLIKVLAHSGPKGNNGK